MKNQLHVGVKPYEIVQMAEILEKNGLSFQDFWRRTYIEIDSIYCFENLNTYFLFFMYNVQLEF